MTRSSSLRCAALAWSAAQLCACAAGPDYRVPEHALVQSSAANAAFVGAQGDASVTPEPVPERWWRLYDDAVLDGLVASALAANTDLRVAGAALARSDALLLEARTLREPSIAIDAGIERSQVAGEQYLLRIRPPESSDYAARVTVGYDLDLWGGIRRGIEEAAADRDAVLAARDLVRVNVVAETARAYADICGAGLELASAQETVRTQRASFELIDRLRAGGRATTLDATRGRLLLREQESTLPALEAAQRNALFRLAELTGKTPAEFDRGIAACASPPRLHQPLPVGDGAELLRRRPDVRRAERQLAAATAAIGVATAELYPDVRLGLALGSLGAIRDFLTAPTNLWNIGAIFHWQANQSAARARVAAADAGAVIALANFDGVVLRSLQDVESALNAYVHDLSREASLLGARADARKAADDARRLEAAGRADAFAVVDAQRTLASVEQQLASIEVAIASDQIAVFLALGGGWTSEGANELATADAANGSLAANP